MRCMNQGNIGERWSVIGACFALAKGGGNEIGKARHSKGAKILAIGDHPELPPSVSTYAANHHCDGCRDAVCKPPKLTLLPKGRGTVRGIGERLAPRQVLGAGFLAVPVSAGSPVAPGSGLTSSQPRPRQQQGLSGVSCALASGPSRARRVKTCRNTATPLNATSSYCLSGSKDLAARGQSHRHGGGDEVLVCVDCGPWG